MFRVAYALRKRTGLIRQQMPAYKWEDRPLQFWLKKNIPSNPEVYAGWRKQSTIKFFFNRQPAKSSDQRAADETQIPGDVPWNPEVAIQEGERILSGELKYFAHKFVQTGLPPDWHKDPISGVKVDSRKHWSEISDEGGVDIKFIWEASRFSLVYPLVRAYAARREEKYPEAFWRLIESWAESNPPNTGPNWMDGQEAALRLMAWTFGFYAFLGSPSTTPGRIAQFTVMVAAHAERIYRNIDYAISTRSNHTISEGFGLWQVGLLFPELKDAEKYFALGRQVLEQEAAAQIFPDGAYSMYSLNYHRFILHLYLYALRLGELNRFQFSSLVLDRVSASIDFLSQLIDPETGQMPVYGSNDGALVLPLNHCDFTDYRPLLQLGSYVTQKQFLLEPGPWDEDIFWLYGADCLSTRERVGVRQNVPSAFPHGGIYLLRGANSKAVIRCTEFRARPSHADQLHLDLWWRGVNIACEAGTYLYSGQGVWRNGLARTCVHNTVTVDHQDQMKMLTRFTWTDWSTGDVLRHDAEIWQGEHNGYKRRTDPVNHRRSVLSLGEDRWLLVDHLGAAKIHHYALHWLLHDCPYEQRQNVILLSLDSVRYQVQVGLIDGKSVLSVVRGDPNSRRGWRSQYYGDKQPAISAMLETDRRRACFWTLFGFEGDLVELRGNTLKISYEGGDTWIDLVELNK
jgi:asparagine synthase (glutamine-hydrolysing)